jgi:hypothetical protein
MSLSQICSRLHKLWPYLKNFLTKKIISDIVTNPGTQGARNKIFLLDKNGISVIL